MSKTFLKILAEEMPIWPRSAVLIWQQMDGVVFYEDAKGHAWELGLYSTADGGFGESVTRSQWEAERARIASQSVSMSDEDVAFVKSDFYRDMVDRKIEQELAAIACGKRSKEDQELWDKVALASTQAFITGHITHFGHENVWQDTELVSCAADYADAFMAERAKRMNG